MKLETVENDVGVVPPKLSSKRGASFRFVLFVAAFIGAALVLSWMLALPQMAKIALEKRTGFPISVRAMGGNPLGFSLEARDLGIGNPEGFGVGSFAEFDEVLADVDLKSIESDTLVFRELHLTASRLSIVISESGESNLDVFASKLEENSQGVHFDRVVWKIEELELIDYSQQRTHRRKLELNVDWTLKDVSSYRDIFVPIQAAAQRVGLSEGVL